MADLMHLKRWPTESGLVRYLSRCQRWHCRHAFMDDEDWDAVPTPNQCPECDHLVTLEALRE